MKPIPLSSFGRDHWSTFGYIECRCVDNKGIPSLDHMRSNPARHPGLSPRGTGIGGWKAEYSTRLKSHTKETPNLAAGHDDWDCAHDLEEAGLVEDLGTGVNPMWKLTPAGLDMAAKLRAHKASGGSFSTFTP